MTKSERLPLSTVYQVLSGLMRPQAPDWFRAGLSELLALLPTKPLGVRNAIEFIAASNNESSSASNTDNHLPSQGPPLPFDALKQASKLLSAVPRSMPIEVYLNMVGPQLMSLLDGDAGPELSQVAAYVIASGFLGKRALGAPGSPGWQYLVEPMQQAINPSTSRSSSRQENGRVQQTRVITSDRDLAQILNRMSALIRAYSNSALTGRLLRPLIQSLWGIASFDASSIVDPVSSSLAKDLLQTFLTLAGGNRELALLAEDLLWDGPQTWTFATGSEGGIAIVTRESVSASSGDLMTILPKIDRRINLLCELISTSSVDDGLLGDLFFKQIKIWFQYRYQIDEHLVETSVARNPQQSMATAKLVLGLLDRFGSRIASRPENAINLISDIIKQRLDSAQYTVPRKKSLLLMNTEETQQNHLSSTMDDDETFDIAISLLSTLVEAPSFKASEESKESLRSIEDSLLSLRSQQIQEATRQTISRALQALSKVHSSSLAGSRPVSDGSQTESRQHAFKQIQQDLSSALPPVRTSAIHSLKSLMRETSFALDVPASAVLLIHLVRSDPEDYVYLAAIRALVLLAEARDARLVTRLLVDAFQDAKEEAGVDGRLRLGEAIIGIVGSISSMPATAVHRQVIEIVSDVAIEVASRRGNRRREQDEKKRKARLDRMKKKEAERAWGGEVPENPTLNLNLNDDDEEYANESPEQRTRRLKELEAMEQIVKGWEDTGPEEDIRVRASALSIVSEVLEHATDLLNQRQVVDAVDMALAILVIESNASQAILRRAAVLTLYALLKSMDRAFEENRQLVVGLEASRCLDIEKVLSLLGDVDPDELVRGHATAVLEGLEAFRMKQILGVRNDGMQDALTPRFTLEGRLQGLDVDVDAVRPVGGKSKIQEIE